MRKFLSILLVFIMVLSLTACGSNIQKESPSSQIKDIVIPNDPTNSSEKTDIISDDTKVPTKDDTFDLYLNDKDNLNDVVETLSVKHARFFVDGKEYNESNDYMTFFTQLFTYAMANDFSDEISEEELDSIPTEEELMEMLKAPLRLETSEAYVLMNFDTGAQIMVQNNNAEDVMNPFKGYQLEDITEENLRAYLQDMMSGSNALVETDDPEAEKENTKCIVGNVYRHLGSPADKVIFEIEVTYEVPDLSELVDASISSEDSKGHQVTVYGYGAIVFNEEDSFTGLFLSADKDRGTTLLSARSLEIDTTIEGISEEEEFGGLFNESDWNFEDVEWEIETELEEEIEDKVNEGLEKSGDFD